MTRLSLLTLILLIAFTILVGMIRLLATPLTLPTTLQPPDCTVGCWSGIHIGETTMDEAQSILQKSGVTPSVAPYANSLEWTDGSGAIKRGSIAPLYDSSGKWQNKVDRIYLELTNKSFISLGDAIILWGNPIGTMTRFCSYSSERYGYLTIFFKGGVQVVIAPSKQTNNTTLSPSALTPNTVITDIAYIAMDNIYFPRELQLWNGFVQFPPNYLVSNYGC